MPPKVFKAPRPSTTKKPTKPKSTTTRKSSGSISQVTTKAKDNGKQSPRDNNRFKISRLSGLPSLSPDSDDPFASDAHSHSSNPASDAASAEDDSREIDSDSQPGKADEHERREGIPPDLLTRLLHENFKEEGTRLSKDASRAVGKYMETFVREALARAAFARVEAEEGLSGSGEMGGFLEVEDLEKLAPQLLLDF